MKHGKHLVDKEHVKTQTYYAKKDLRKLIENVEKLKFDTEREQRLEEGLCPQCYYIHKTRIGGCAMTTQPCGICDKEVLYSSTATDKVCTACAKEHEICKRCAAAVDYAWDELGTTNREKD